MPRLAGLRAVGGALPRHRRQGRTPTCILSNHTVYDGSKTKLPAVKARKPGAAHPYVVGNEVVRRYLTTVGECAQAAIAIVKARPPAVN